LAGEIIYFGKRRHLRYQSLCGVIQNDSCSIQTAFEMDTEDAWRRRGKSSLGGVSDANVPYATHSYPAKLNHLVRIHREDQNI
jgi:hypothetical protein